VAKLSTAWKAADGEINSGAFVVCPGGKTQYSANGGEHGTAGHVCEKNPSRLFHQNRICNSQTSSARTVRLELGGDDGSC
jgi:hypothetical protein